MITSAGRAVDQLDVSVGFSKSETWIVFTYHGLKFELFLTNSDFNSLHSALRDEVNNFKQESGPVNDVWLKARRDFQEKSDAEIIKVANKALESLSADKLFMLIDYVRKESRAEGYAKKAEEVKRAFKTLYNAHENQDPD